MTDELPVHISREELHSLEVPSLFQTTGPFDVRLVNHGESLHIHLHLDDPLSEVAAIDAGNHYVESESERHVRVDVDTDRLGEDPHRGKLKIASGYGAETRWVDVELTEPQPESDSVTVDESLAQPQPNDAGSNSLFDNPELPVIGLGLVALLVAGLAAVVIQDTLILLGALVVLAGVFVALFFLLRNR